MLPLACCCALIAALALYLANRHQTLRVPAGIPRRSLRIAAVSSALVAFALATAARGFWAGAFATFTALMAAAVALPYLDAALRRRRAARAAATVRIGDAA